MAEAEGSRRRKVLIIGAGPVGALTALSLDKRGWDVEVWDAREDPRGQPINHSNLRSINLAISSRGVEALKAVDPSLADQFLAEAVPMRARMIHHVDGRQEAQVYDPAQGQCINSISRPLLNQRLVERLPAGVRTRFHTKLSRLDLRARRAWGKNAGPRVQPGQEHDDGKVGGRQGGQGVDAGKSEENGREDKEPTAFDLIIGCDGSWSRVRTEMMRLDRIDFSQSFIPYTYIELHMPALPNGEPAIGKNYLHIWPRHSYMLIALPNQDGSFTLTAFLPYDSLKSLETEEQVAQWFKTNFPDAVEVIGVTPLVKTFMSNPRGNMVTIHVSQLSWSSHALLLGDASHSMVPFYGQGLNCGLEDVRILNSYLTQHHIDSTTSIKLGETDEQLAAAFSAYSTARVPDLQAICDLALRNHLEMQSSVLSPAYHFRRIIDSVLSAIAPSGHKAQLSLTDPFPTRRVRGWTRLYEMVTFRPDVGYAEALRREQWQQGILDKATTGLGLGAAGALAYGGVLAWHGLRRWADRR